MGFISNLFQRKPIQKNYISEIDQFLIEFDKRKEASSISRRAEEAQYAKIFYLRDNPVRKAECKIWESF